MLNKLQSVCFIVNEECNNRCIHCYNHYQTRKKGFMSKSVFLTGLNQATSYGIHNINISGGEALLHPDILLFISEVKKRNFHFRLYTNGQLIDKKLCELLQEMDLSPISITVYSMDEKVHDSITQNHGSLRHTLEGIELLRQYNIPFQISLPVMKQNLSSFTSVYDYFSAYSAISVGPNPFISETVNHQHTNASVIMSDEEMSVFAHDYYYYSIEHGFQIFPKLHKSKDVNLFDASELTIQPDGSIVAGTLVSDISLGSILSDSLIDIWNNSEDLKYWRSLTADELDGCSTCEYLQQCNPNIGDNWVSSNSFSKKSETWCRQNKTYYSTLYKLSDGGRYCIEVSGCPGFVFFPGSIKEKEDGQKYADAIFKELLARNKYHMTDEEIDKEKNRTIIVQL